MTSDPSTPSFLFAILNDHNADSKGNFAPFREVFERITTDGDSTESGKNSEESGIRRIRDDKVIAINGHKVPVQKVKHWFWNPSLDNPSLSEQNRARMDALLQLLSAWKRLDADDVADLLDDPFQYGSYWVSEEMHGKATYLEYLHGKFDSIRRSNSAPTLTVVKIWEALTPQQYAYALHLVQGAVETLLTLEFRGDKISSLYMTDPDIFTFEAIREKGAAVSGNTPVWPSMKIVRRREDGGMEIDPPHVLANEPMPIVLERGNESRRRLAREQGRQCAPVYAIDFPVSGGWGYTLETACVIELHTSRGYDLERLFVERRIYEEVIVHPAPDTPNLNCLRWNLLKQCLHRVNGRKFDEMTYEVTGFLEPDLKFLRSDWETHDAYKDDEDGRSRHEVLAATKRFSYKSTYWFDITSFFPRG